MLGRCDTCGGLLVDSSDLYGQYKSCLTCGAMWYGEASSIEDIRESVEILDAIRGPGSEWERVMRIGPESSPSHSGSLRKSRRWPSER